MPALALGDQAPAFELPGTDGNIHAVSEASEPAVRTTVVYWTCNHCPYALAWHERLIQVANDYGDRGVRFLAINSNDAEKYPADSFEAMKERVKSEANWPHPYLHDESQKVAKDYGVQKTPDVYVLDEDLKLRYRGAPDSNYDDPAREAAWLRAAIDDLLAGRQVEMAESTPIGCSIKWK